MTFRKVLFWLHLIAGTLAGSVILIMSATGVLLMYEKQVMAWADEREYRAAPPAGAARLPIETLIANVSAVRQATAAAVALRAAPDAPAMFSFGRERAVYVNPYTGAILGEGSPRVRKFFRAVTDWHRWLGAQDENRAGGKAVTGACNVAFLFIVISGLYLWWPRTWNWRSLRAVTWFRAGLPGKARDFNWHNVIGFWCFVPLFFVVLSGAVISYPWAGNLVYRIAGSAPPAVRRPPAPPGGAGLSLVGIGEYWQRAERQVPDWKTISLRLPSSNTEPLAFTVDRGSAGQPHRRETLLVNRRTGEQRWEAFADLEAGRRLRSWLRFVHTGEYYGLAGQTIAGIASLGGVFLVYTGLALAWRRFWSWQARRFRNEERVLVDR